jgi:hypothetical protein
MLGTACALLENHMLGTACALLPHAWHTARLAHLNPHRCHLLPPSHAPLHPRPAPQEQWAIFPEAWRVPQTLCLTFCKLTRAHLKRLLSDGEGAPGDVGALIKTVVATNKFEKEMAQLFGGGLAGGRHCWLVGGEAGGGGLLCGGAAPAWRCSVMWGDVAQLCEGDASVCSCCCAGAEVVAGACCQAQGQLQVVLQCCSAAVGRQAKEGSVSLVWNLLAGEELLCITVSPAGLPRCCR